MAEAEAAQVSPERARAVSGFARTLTAAARNWALYPAEHPAMVAALDRWLAALRQVTAHGAVSFAVLPDTVLMDGETVPADGAIAEAAALLHKQHILEVRFEPQLPVSALRGFLSLLKIDEADLQARGGPAKVWGQTGHPGIALQQIDYHKVLQEGAIRNPSRRDDLWRSIVDSILDRSRPLDEGAQRRLLEIAGDADAIAELTADVMDLGRAADGSPLISTQAAAVLTSYRQLMGVVTARAPEQIEQARQNIAAAAARLDSNVAIEMLRRGGQAGEGPDYDITREMITSFSDEQVARLLAMTLGLQGQDTDRLAQVFGSLAPDEDRCTRVVGMARAILIEQLGESDRFRAVWRTMEELVVTYDDTTYTDAGYRGNLHNASSRGATMAAEDLPQELPTWLATLTEGNLRRLSVTMVLDLLRLEREPARAGGLINELGTTVEDLLLSAEYAEAASIVRVLARHARHQKALAVEDARRVLEELGASTVLAEACGHLDVMDEGQTAALATICHGLGPATIPMLIRHLLMDQPDAVRSSLIDLIGWHGELALLRLDPLRRDSTPAARCALARVLGRIGTAEAVRQLQPLLRAGEPRVVGAAVRALAQSDDPSAPRMLQTLLKSASGPQRAAVVATLVEQPDRRTTPMLMQVLDDSAPLGDDHAVVLETLRVLGQIADERAIEPIARVMRCRGWFQRSRARAVKQAAVAALLRIESPRAKAVLLEARRGDRLLRNVAREMGGAVAP